MEGRVVKFISRKDLGWPASAAPLQPVKPLGVKVHYEGTHSPVRDHSYCKGYWTQIRNSHLANKAEGYSDVAYNLAVCRHGYVLEGRGAGRQTGANGNQALNRAHYSVCVLYGTNDSSVSSEVVTAVREAIQYLRDHGAGKEIKGHRDGYATACPGDPLYALVKSGKFEPQKEEDEVTPADIEKIADAVAKKVLGGDGIVPAPTSAPDYATNKFWSLKSHIATLHNTINRIEAKLK